MMMKGDDADHSPEQIVREHRQYHLDGGGREAVSIHRQDETVPKIVEGDGMGGSSYRLHYAGHPENRHTYWCDLEFWVPKRQEAERMVFV